MTITPDQLSIEITPGEFVYRRSDGKLVQGNRKIYDDFTFALVCEGRVCILCDHIQSVAMPERCEFGDERWRCPMRIRDDQLRVLQANFEGFEDMTPPDPAELEDAELAGWMKTRSGIAVPRG